MKRTVSNCTWHDLASSPRWRGVASFIRNWVGPFEADVGMRPEELDAILGEKGLDLPAAVREWHILAANWKQGGLNVWIHPQDLAVIDGELEILSDTEGVTCWRVRVADCVIDDPPIVSNYDGSDRIACPRFSQFVADMIINDVIYGEKDEPLVLDREAARAALTCLDSSLLGRFYANSPLEAASVIAYFYSDTGPAHGKARTVDGRELLQRLVKGQ